EKRQIKDERLAICSTHSHTTPALTGILPTMFGAPLPPEHQERVDRYTRALTDRVEQVALAALDDLKPSRISFGIGKIGFAINRRTRGGPVDHDLPVMAVMAPDGKLRGVYLGYACHCVVMSDNKISGDWAGCAAEQLERKHAGAVALVSVGCGADSNPASGVTGDKGEVAQQYGSDIVAEVDRLLAGKLAEVSGNLECESDEIALPLAPLPSREYWADHTKDEGPPGYYAQVQLEKIDRGEALPTEVDYSIQTWKFGDSLAMVFLPGEVVVDYALRLKSEFDADRLWTTAYANDCPAYIPSERILKEGGYEAGDAMRYYGLPAWFAPGLEETIVSAIAGQLGDQFKTAEEVKGTEKVKANEEAVRTGGVAPKSPNDSLAAIEVAKGLRVELMASEPMVRDPVAIDFGPDGKLWVAEMSDYNCKDSEVCPPEGRITVLEDRDADGTFDDSTTFLDKIPCPMGVTVWRGGVLICAAPDVLYAEDTTGDGKADVVKKLFTGFGTEHPQARVNGFAYGLDGWLYAGCSFGGKLHNHVRGEDFTHPDRDFRVQVDEGILEAETGRTQQGRVRDDWGNWFGCNNSVLCWHYPLSERYLRRNSQVLPPSLSVNVASAAATRLFPQGELVLWELSGPPGKPTAACGIGVYRDELLGPEFTNNVFTCEPVNQLVHRMMLNPAGATFVGERATGELESEFLSSTDNWFRPVQARTGPDGALWIVDMYRYVIEHSRWIPQADLDKLDVKAGSSLGRIYRVVPEEGEARPFKRLDKLDSRELAAAIDSPNGWQRDMAQQMLAWRDNDADDAAAVESLEQLVGQSPRAATRLQSLCTLETQGWLRDDLLKSCLSDAHPAVRRQAIRLAETRLNDSPEMAEAVLELVHDPDAPVALQLASSLGELDDSRTAAALAAIALEHADDPYVVSAVLTSVSGTEGDLIAAVFGEPTTTVPMSIVSELMEFFGSVSDRRAVRAALAEAAEQSAGAGERRFAALAAFVAGLDRNALTIDELLEPEAANQLGKLCESCVEVATDADAALPTRLDCAQVIGRSPRVRSDHIAALGSLLTAAQDPKLQSAALSSLAAVNQNEVAEELLRGWSGYTPGLRTRVLDVLLSREQWVRALLGAIDSHEVQASEVDASHRAQLAEFPDQELRELAERHFTQDSSGERAAVVARYQGSLPAGDMARGEELYKKHCASCHKFHDVGEQVGPDLATIEDRSRDALLREILDPNRAVDQRYAEYLALTVDGMVKKGILVEESGNAITLRGLQREETTLLRSELESLATVGKSLMPEGFENELSVQEMADVLQFLTSP
nr:c-type cytochrome [Pirellulales bacterium]